MTKKTELLRELVHDSFDFHVHISPDPFQDRFADADELARQAKASGMRGIVLKSHDYPTAPVAHLTRKLVEGIEIVGSVTLNEGVGGINPHAVEVSARLGGKIVWMPTTSALAARKKKGSSKGISILEESGKVLPEVKEILALTKEFDLVLCTGHLSREEIVGLCIEALHMGVGKCVVTHPLNLAGTSLDLDVQKDLTEKGAFIEHCFLPTISPFVRLDPARIVEAIRFVGVNKCLLSTDFGQLQSPPPSEGMRMMIATFLQFGLSREDIHILVKENPYRLLDLR